MTIAYDGELEHTVHLMLTFNVHRDGHGERLFGSGLRSYKTARSYNIIRKSASAILSTTYYLVVTMVNEVRQRPSCPAHWCHYLSSIW